MNIGLSALGGVVDSQVFLNLDASATLTLGLEAEALGVVVVDPKAPATSAAVRRDSMRLMSRGYPIYKNRAEAPKVEDIAPRSTVAAVPATSSAASKEVSVDGSAKFGGCVQLGTGLDVNAGANSDFFGLFNVGTSVNLFSKKFELFKVRF